MSTNIQKISRMTGQTGWIHKILILTGGVRKTPIPKQENNYTENSLVHK